MSCSSQTAQVQLRVLLRVEVVAGQRCRELDGLGVRVVGSSEHRDLATQRGDVALDDAVGALQVSGRAQCLDGLPRARAVEVVDRSSVERKDWVGAGVSSDPVQERRVVISPDQVERAVAADAGELDADQLVIRAEVAAGAGGLARVRRLGIALPGDEQP